MRQATIADVATGVCRHLLAFTGILLIVGFWIGVAVADIAVAREIYRVECDNKMRSAVAFVLFSLSGAYFLLWLLTRRPWRMCVNVFCGGKARGREASDADGKH